MKCPRCQSQNPEGVKYSAGSVEQSCVNVLGLHGVESSSQQILRDLDDMIGIYETFAYTV